MTKIEDMRANFGGMEMEAENEKAHGKVGAFMDRVNDIHEEHTVPLAVIVGVKKAGERLYGDDPQFLIDKDYGSDNDETVIVWRHSDSPFSLGFDPMVLIRNSEGVNVYEVPDAYKVYEETDMRPYLTEDKKSLTFGGDDLYNTLEDIANQLLEREIEFKPLDLISVAQFLGTLEMENPRVIDYSFESDEEYDDEY